MRAIFKSPSGGERARRPALLRRALAAAVASSFLLHWADDTAAIAKGLWGGRDREMLVKAPGFEFGIYDPHSLAAVSSHFQLEHVFVAWQSPDEGVLDSKIAVANSAGRSMMISVEPFTHAADWRAGGDRLFADILAGGYDAEINDVCRKARAVQGRVYMRWGHEMEDVDGRYPWARRDPAGYRKAFAYFVERCRKILPGAQYVWSPKGHKKLDAYYPGDRHVDIIGLPVWGLEKMDIDYWNHPRGFSDTFAEKYDRVAHFDKPILVAELGVAGSLEYKHSWYEEIFASHLVAHRFPLLIGISFFNDKEPYHWPLGYGSPDWRFDSETLARLTPPRN